MLVSGIRNGGTKLYLVIFRSVVNRSMHNFKNAARSLKSVPKHNRL